MSQENLLRLHWTHTRAIRAGLADLNPFPKQHMDLTTQEARLTGTKILNTTYDQIPTEKHVILTRYNFREARLYNYMHHYQ
jgi:hypothetical protein